MKPAPRSTLLASASALRWDDPALPKPASVDPGDRSTTFRPVQGGTELQSGEKLLVEAYAAIWLILFGFIFLSWRRQKKLDARIVDLEREIVRSRGAAQGARAKTASNDGDA